MTSLREWLPAFGREASTPWLQSLAAPRRRAQLWLILGACCLGLSPIVVKALPLSAEVSAFYRVALSAPLMLAFMVIMERRGPAREAGPVVGGPPWWLYGLAALLFAADLLAMHLAIRLTNASVATLFTNCAPFFVGVFGLLGLADRPTRAFWTALPVGLAGMAMIVGVSAVGSGGDLVGDAVALLAGLLYGAYLVAVRRLKLAGASSTRIIVAVTAGSALCLAPVMATQDFLVPTDGRTIALLLVLVLVGQVAGQGLVTMALKHLPVTSSSMVLLIQPVVAAPLAYVFLGERLTMLQLLGMALVLVSIALATRPERPRPERGGEAR